MTQSGLSEGPAPVLLNEENTSRQWTAHPGMTRPGSCNLPHCLVMSSAQGSHRW
ncbi:hypothetical protein NQZ68_013300, partial [Dissostichus eleginoides]